MAEKEYLKSGAACKYCVHFDICCEDWAFEDGGRVSVDRYKVIMADKAPCRHYNPDMVEIRHADWIEMPNGSYICSDCRRPTVDDKNGCWALTNYCHNCGACMIWKGGSNDKVR